MAMAAMLTASAQEGGDRINQEEFQMELEQYVTRKACLSPQEASRFFPAYEEMVAKQRCIRNRMRSLRRIRPATDAECKGNIQAIDNLEIEMKQLQREYHEKFMQLLPAGKVYDVMRAEDAFMKEAFRNVARDVGKGK